MTDTDRRTEPALTAEEWQNKRIVRGDETYSGNGPTARLTGDALECANTWDYEDSRSGWTGPDRHALAALALYGQTFGFTWEDVETILLFADPDEVVVEGEEPSPLRSLANRLAALLPPR